MDRYKKLLWLIFKENTEGCDIYHNHGSIWLILTDERKWVFELTKEGTLWYNYYFFKDCFRLLSLDVKENQKYITDWVVEKIQNGVKHTDACQIGTSTFIEDAIQNGVKDTQWGTNQRKNPIEDTIRNGVKDTFLVEGTRNRIVEDTIQNGVKETKYCELHSLMMADHIIRDGIKETHWRRVDNHSTYLDRIIKN